MRCSTCAKSVDTVQFRSTITSRVTTLRAGARTGLTPGVTKYTQQYKNALHLSVNLMSEIEELEERSLHLTACVDDQPTCR